MSKLPSIALAATLLSVGIPDAQAKQRCRDAAPSNKQGEWWSYRLIDGRKCWYQGKPMLSKALLEWPRQASVRPVSREKASNAVTQKPGNPLDAQALMDAQARAVRDSDTFEAMWRERVDVLQWAWPGDRRWRGRQLVLKDLQIGAWLSTSGQR